MIFRLNHSSGVPLYLQLMEQMKHAIDIGALRAGEQLPAIRKIAEELVMNPNTVARAYRELEHEGIIELKHGSGAFVSTGVVGRSKVMRKAQTIVEAAIQRMSELGLTEEEIRRFVENELSAIRTGASKGDRNG